MAFSLFKKNKKDPVTPPQQGKKKSSLVPVGEVVEKKEEDKKVVTAQTRTWKNFPLTSDAILMRPIMTEKAIRLSTTGKYVFEVRRSTSKILIRKAFFNAYGVMPSKIAVIRQDGKEVSRGKQTGRRRAVKKAIVTIPKGKQVDIGI